MSGSVDCNRPQLRVLGAVVIALTPCDAHVGHECGSLIGMRENTSALRYCDPARRIILKSYSAKASCHPATWPSGSLKLFNHTRA